MSFYADVLALAENPIFGLFLIASNVVALLCWIATLITDNYSQIDCLWSILPGVYAWAFLYTATRYGLDEGSNGILPGDLSSRARLVIICVLATLWGTRLTYNYWRKGGYKIGEQDYRWVHVKKMFNYPDTKVYEDTKKN